MFTTIKQHNLLDCCEVAVCLLAVVVFVRFLLCVLPSHLFLTVTGHLMCGSEMNRTKSNIFWIKIFPLTVFVVAAAQEVVQFDACALALMVGTLQASVVAHYCHSVPNNQSESQ